MMALQSLYTGFISTIGLVSQNHRDLPTPLGLFSNLPLEIRYEIWSYFVPAILEDNPSWATTLKFISRYIRPSRFAILQTSKQLYDEISSVFYAKGLCFFIKQPQALPTGLDSRLTDAKFRSLLFPRFKQIRFEIYLQEQEENAHEPSECLECLLDRIRATTRFYSGLEARYPPSDHPSLATLQHVEIAIFDRGWPNRPGSILSAASRGSRFEQALRLLQKFEYLGPMRSLSVQLPPSLTKGDKFAIESYAQHFETVEERIQMPMPLRNRRSGLLDKMRNKTD